MYQTYSKYTFLRQNRSITWGSFCGWFSTNQASGSTKCFYTKLLPKNSSARANCDIQKNIEDFLNVVTDIDSIASINNSVTNSVTEMTTRIINIFFGKTTCYINIKLYYLAFNKKNKWIFLILSSCFE